MAIKKVPDGWQADVQPGGRGHKRYRKTFRRKVDAERWENSLKVKLADDPSYLAPKKDTRRLSDLIERWYVLHGSSLKSGSSRRQRLLTIADSLGNPLVSSMTAEQFGDFRAARLSAGISPDTVNHDLAYVRALFRELTRFGEWNQSSPVSSIRKLKTDERELAFLSLDQVAALFAALDQSRNPDVGKIVRVCLSTGARWSEAQYLRAEQVTRYRIEFRGTKNGKVRSVPICEDLFDMIALGRPGRLFRPGYRAFQNAVERCDIVLPEGQLTHVLRHTFASHFMMNGGDILVLQKILGHSTLTMTMRYAHLSPDHLEQAVRFNPLSALTFG